MSNQAAFQFKPIHDSTKLERHTNNQIITYEQAPGKNIRQNQANGGAAIRSKGKRKEKKVVRRQKTSTLREKEEKTALQAPFLHYCYRDLYLIRLTPVIPQIPAFIRECSHRHISSTGLYRM